MIRTEISGAEIAEEMEKERRFFQLQMCEVRIDSFHWRILSCGCNRHFLCSVCVCVYASVSSIGLLQYLLKVNEIKIKKGVDLLQNLIKYFHAQCK